MDNYHHARLTFVRREELAKRVVEGGLSLKLAMVEFKLTPQSVGKWVRRYREQGVAGLKDRFASSPLAARHTEGEDHGDRITQTRALDRCADRAAARSESGYGQPRSAPVEAKPHPQSGTEPSSQPP
jgi:transposase-like protein